MTCFQEVNYPQATLTVSYYYQHFTKRLTMCHQRLESIQFVAALALLGGI